MKKTFLLFVMLMTVMTISAQNRKPGTAQRTKASTTQKARTGTVKATPAAVATPDKTPEGVEAVDLGLPSGTMWANRNVGANADDGVGTYFAWGDTGVARSFGWSVYKWAKNTRSGNFGGFTKYNNDSSFGVVDKKSVLEAADDAAHVNWGGKWSMPTEADVQELLAGTSTKRVTSNSGVNGVLLTSKTNGNTIFLPAAGYLETDYSETGGKIGDYWTACIEKSLNGENARTISFNVDNGGYVSLDYAPRKRGLTVRPVKRK